MSNFSDSEKLYRAVRPQSRYWTKDGTRLSSVAFRNRSTDDYLSVDRQDGRRNDDCIEAMRKRLKGAVVSVKYAQCLDLKIEVIPYPSDNNPWHCGLVNNADEGDSRLSQFQCQNLADFAVIEFKE